MIKSAIEDFKKPDEARSILPFGILFLCFAVVLSCLVVVVCCIWLVTTLNTKQESYFQLIKAQNDATAELVKTVVAAQHEKQSKLTEVIQMKQTEQTNEIQALTWATQQTQLKLERLGFVGVPAVRRPQRKAAALDIPVTPEKEYKQ